MRMAELSKLSPRGIEPNCKKPLAQVCRLRLPRAEGVGCVRTGLLLWQRCQGMSGDAEVPDGAAPLSLSILEITRSAQLQHGLRHGDHGRYR